MTRLGRWIYDSMGRAPALLVFFAIPMGVAWYVGRHALWWMFQIIYALETGGPRHFGHPPHPESQIANGEVWFAWMAAYIVGAFVMQAGWLRSGYESVGRAEHISPTALYFLTPQRPLGCLGAIFFPLALVLFAPYLAAQIVFAVSGLLGGRALLGTWLRRRTAPVVDIAPGSPWRQQPYTR